jgi:hypothetical protein
MMKMNSRTSAVGAALLLLLLVLGFRLVSQEPMAQPFASANAAEWPSMRECVADALKRTGAAAPTVESMKAATELCYSHLHGQGLLNDFKIRRLKFIQQAYDERVLLWMVVAITLSGVALAAVQLIASFRLATQGIGNLAEQTELSVERGKLSIRSSLTGLLILICSFAFFWVFVYEIYVIHDPDDKPKPQMQQANEQIGIGVLQPYAPASAASSAAPPRSR